MPLTFRELLGVRSLAIQGAVLACLVVLFTLIGPFGTYVSISPLGRIGYWSLALGANWLVCSSIMMMVVRLTFDASWWRRLLAIAAAAVLAAIPGTGVVYTAESLFRPGNLDQITLPEIYLGVAVLMVAISTLVVAVMTGQWSMGGTGEPESTGAGSETPPTVRFLDRLPPNLGRDLIYLKMADHYVEAFTTAGSTLVLMRFADAVSELDGAGGLRVHRSYWVAGRHVTRAERRNGRTILCLTGGHEAPVSRGYLPAVRQAGLA